MILLTAILIAVLFSLGLFLVVQKGFVRILFGVALMNHAANLFVISTSGDPSGKVAPLVTGQSQVMVDPLPQALILTAIVIGFGVMAYFVVLLYRIYLEHGTTSLTELFQKTRSEE